MGTRAIVAASLAVSILPGAAAIAAPAVHARPGTKPAARVPQGSTAAAETPPASASPAPGTEPAAAEAYADAVEGGRRIVRALMSAADIPAVSVAVAVRGRTVWSAAFGLADLEQRVPATTESRFRIASLSKNLTGTAVAKLVAGGRLDLDAPIDRYVKDLPVGWKGITVRHLASHTSSIPHYGGPEDALNTVHYASTREAVEKVKRMTLLHAPGEKETYSSYAYTILAAVIEGATGTPFLEFMKKEIFDPLGMAGTLADDPAAIIPGRTAYYDYTGDGRVVNAAYTDLSDRWAGSGFLSTAGDLARFGSAHIAPGLLSKEALSSLAEPAALPGGGRTREGLGWGPREDWEGRATLWGNGRTPGSTCGLLVYPFQGVVVALLSNVRRAPIERGDLQAIGQRFLAAVAGETAGRPSGDALGHRELEGTVEKTTYRVTLSMAEAGGAYAGALALTGEGPQPTTFTVFDAFTLGPHLWVYAVDRKIGVVPVRLRLEGDAVSGEILHTGIRLTGKKPEAAGR